MHDSGTSEDLVLNTARMHDASQFSWHRISTDIASLDYNSAIMAGAQKEVNSRKRSNVGGNLLGRGRASTRGGGGSTSRNVVFP